MRISGIASGFDTEEMVRQLMQAERVKVDRVEQNRQTILWRQESYNNMNKAFANFILNTQKDMGLKKAGSTGALFNNSYKDLDYIRSATSSNETVATIRSTGKTVNGSFSIEVGKGGVPQNASFTSAKIESLDDINKESVQESVTKGKGDNEKHYRQIRFNVDGKEVVVSKEVKKSTDVAEFTMEDVAKAINDTKVRTDKDNNILTEAQYDKLLSEKPDEAKKVKETPLGISAFYDKGTGRMFLESSEGGKEIKIDSGGYPSGVALVGKINGTKKEGPLKEGESLDEGESLSIKGNQGEVRINGVSVDVKNGKVEFNGLTIDIKAEGTTRIEVSTNTEGIMEKIQKLVADYNDLVDMASGAVGEKVYRDYKPLSAEEKKAMTEDDVKLWEEKAKSGLLNRDETLQRTLQRVRTDLYETVGGLSGKFSHITQIGISTERYAKGSAGGKLEIDEEKLRKAIEEDPDGVMELLFNDPKALPGRPTMPVQGEGEDPVEFDKKMEVYKTELKDYEMKDRANRKSQGGIFTRTYDNLIDGMKSIVEKSGTGENATLYRNVRSNMLIDFVTTKGSISDLDKSVAEMNKQIDNLNILLAKREEGHYAKFTAMEKAMYQMNNQSSWLSQQFG